MYKRVFSAEVTAITIFTPREGDVAGSNHGMTVTAKVNTSSLDFFMDLDFGSKSDTVAALINGECPVEYPFDLEFVKKENVELQFGKVKETCSLQKVQVTGFDNGVYAAKISIKCPSVQKANRAEFVGLHMQTVDFLLTPTQEELVAHEEAAPKKKAKILPMKTEKKPKGKKKAATDTTEEFENSEGVEV